MKLIAPNLYSFEGLLVGRVYLIEDSDGLTIIDGGLAQTTNRINSQIEASGHKLTDIKHILLTHAHPDHVGALAELKAHSGAPIITSALEKPVAEGKIPVPTPKPSTLSGIWRLMRSPKTVFKGITVDQTVAEGDVIPALGGLQVVAVPGHAPGQIAFWQPQRKILIMGDTMMHIFGGLRLPFAVATVDMAEAKRSIKKVAQLDVEIACFGHGNPITENTATQIRLFALSFAPFFIPLRLCVESSLLADR
jgi:glyoxylase-like metal-dependent hydrolase (beta-lactamase superfamily II)